ncbi:uncharacterized protein CIMG_07057 [Coccidioides immitis RS]|uniref:Uncharacterized protein n=4 Tax=Coccidioides TaxID=5500 RepID=J3K9J3_COCIM|nr:uncharacterized protein CIMG_07057 [Coccidioides immitis RS]EFW23218.1 conserved hypothetical protein [Coccidioides posadasii str. Silveira]KMM68091.1 hypothetical protein CPAG_04423 [Coccidioides posadasii RMSCC 3488]KMP04224.1 hypothetical protein CIRG_03915 [Coccidioides immitis RMSCC 2394]TPX24331.1 hypothetical protein DIZ76_013677 [Coccidioides immitis]EAS31578.3 hypothetical protein CIMG_07057 [Coccidioides immitis RS]
MRAGLSLLLPILVQATGYDRTSPFHQPVIDGSDIIARDGIEALLLLKRQNGCPAGFNSCAFLDAPGACCQRDTICSRDDANNIACCPTGAACTGILTQSSSATTSSGFMFPEPGTATTTNPPSLTGSTVPNAPFPFVYIPTSFRDQPECVQSYSGCVSQFQACASSLGGVNGVTISGADGAGTTVQGVEPTADAQSICLSLSREACYGLQEAYCTAFQDGSSGASPPSTRTSPLYEILTGLGIALAGMIA